MQSLRASFRKTEPLTEEESGPMGRCEAPEPWRLYRLVRAVWRTWQSCQECGRKGSAGAGAFAIASQEL